MLRNLSRLECKIGDKDYYMLCDVDSPIAHVKEAIFQFSKYIGQIEDQIKVNAVVEQPKEEEPNTME